MTKILNDILQSILEGISYINPFGTTFSYEDIVDEIDSLQQEIHDMIS